MVDAGDELGWVIVRVGKPALPGWVFEVRYQQLQASRAVPERAISVADRFSAKGVQAKREM